MMRMCSVCHTPKEETEFRLMKKKSLYEKGYRPLLSITIPGKCDETVVER